MRRSHAVPARDGDALGAWVRVPLKHLLQLTDQLPVSGSLLTLTETSPSFSGDLERPFAIRKVIVAVEHVKSTGSEAAVTLGAVNDQQHVGDIAGALGALKRGAPNSRSWRKKIRFLLVSMGPGLIVMGGGNDAGGVQVHAQMGQDYGMRLPWTLIPLFPILFFCQEMVVRPGAVSGIWRVFALPSAGRWYAQSGERNP